jgi:small subunit ribosomal protein S14
MAKTSVVQRNLKRIQMVKNRLVNRFKLKELIRKNPGENEEMIVKLQKRKRNESPIRVRERCRLCGRPCGTLRKFGLCRIHLREAVMRGDVPGMRKASW